eukprot:SAG22_NODE_2221_length_2822_cov_1.317297_2_plen_221_part_00
MNNWYLYQDVEGDGRWSIVPWDLDKTSGLDNRNVQSYATTQYHDMALTFPLDGVSHASGVSSRQLNSDLISSMIKLLHCHCGFNAHARASLAATVDWLGSSRAPAESWLGQEERRLQAQLELMTSADGRSRSGRQATIGRAIRGWRAYLRDRVDFITTRMRAGEPCTMQWCSSGGGGRSQTLGQAASFRSATMVRLCCCCCSAATIHHCIPCDGETNCHQ